MSIFRDLSLVQLQLGSASESVQLVLIFCVDLNSNQVRLLESSVCEARLRSNFLQFATLEGGGVKIKKMGCPHAYYCFWMKILTLGLAKLTDLLYYRPHLSQNKTFVPFAAGLLVNMNSVVVWRKGNFCQTKEVYYKLYTT